MVYMVTWESRGGTAGGQQVALTLDRAETIRRVVSASRPWLVCKVAVLDGYVVPGEDSPPPAPPTRRPRKPAAGPARPERRTRRQSRP